VRQAARRPASWAGRMAVEFAGHAAGG